MQVCRRDTLGAAARPLYEAERRNAARAGAAALPSWAQFEKTTLAEVRAQGLGRADGAVVAGVSAMAAPVFDHRGAIVLALTAIGPSAALATAWHSPVAMLLRQAAVAASVRLGHRPGDPAQAGPLPTSKGTAR